MLEGTSGDCLVQPPCTEQGQLEKVARGHVQLGFEYLQEGSLQRPSG